jgi:hypothetical protein
MIHFFVHQHNRHACFFIALQNRFLPRRRAAMAGEKRGMNIDASFGRNI